MAMSKLLSAPKYCYLCIPKHSQLKLILQNHNLGFYKLDISRSFYSCLYFSWYLQPEIETHGCKSQEMGLDNQSRSWNLLTSNFSLYFLPPTYIKRTTISQTKFQCVSVRIFPVAERLLPKMVQNQIKSVINFHRSATFLWVGGLHSFVTISM